MTNPKEYMRRYYLAHKIEWSRARKRRYEIINAIKNRPCMDCGDWFNPWQMEFDHRDRTTKIASISNLVNLAYPMIKIYREIAKCDLVCANGHQERTHKFGQYFRVAK